MRFLHLADLHLDSPFAGRTAELRARLRQAARNALSMAVSVAVEEKVDALLIAGDLLDGEHMSFATERHLMAELSRLEDEGIQVVYVTGNHDPGIRGGAVSRIPWPEGVRVIDGPAPVEVEILRDGTPVGVVTGAGHPGDRFGEDLSRAFPRPRGPLPQVGLLHTQVGGASGEGDHHRYAPSELVRLERSGHHYWALGHIHLRQELSATPAIHYPGNLQGRSPRETGAKGGLLVDLSAPRAPLVEFVELAPIRWERLRVEGLESLERIDEVVRRVEEAWREARETDSGRPGTDWLVRAELTGPSPLFRDLGSEEDQAGMAEVLAGTLGLLDMEIRTDAVRPFRRVEPHLDRQDVVGQALRLLRDLVRDPDRSPAAELELEPGDLAGYEIGGDAALDEYLRSLLEGEEATLVDALLEDRE
jgi:DNA repair protein SbcD/Mre11